MTAMMPWLGLGLLHPGRPRCRFHRHSGGRGVAGDRLFRRRHRRHKRRRAGSSARRPARTSDQSARERPAPGHSALCVDGRADQPPAARRRALSLLPRHASGTGGSGGLGLRARRPARADERFGRRQRAGFIARGRAAACRLGHCAAAPRRNHHRGEHARRRRAAVAGADPSWRRHVERAHHCGDRDRPRRSRDQYPGCVSRRVGARRPLSRRLPPARLVVQSPARAGRNSGAERRTAPDGTAGGAGGGDRAGDIDPARRRRRRIFLCRRGRGDGRLHAPGRGPRQRAIAACRSQRSLARRADAHRRPVLPARCRHHVDAGLAHPRHRSARRRLDRRHSRRHVEPRPSSCLPQSG